MIGWLSPKETLLGGNGHLEKIFYHIFSSLYAFPGNFSPLSFLPVSIETAYYPMEGDYGKKDLENANMEAPGDSEFPLGAFSALCFREPQISKKLTPKEVRNVLSKKLDRWDCCSFRLIYVYSACPSATTGIRKYSLRLKHQYYGAGQPRRNIYWEL